MKRGFHRSGLKTAGIVGAAVLSLSLAACSTDEAEDAMASATSSATSMSQSASSSAAAQSEADKDAPFGPACQDYVAAHPDGPASLEALKDQNIADAVGNIPELKTLAAALSGGLNPDVDLTGTLRDGQWTVFAPTEEAFAKLDEATVAKLKEDSDLLTSILTYHVVDGQAAPSQAIGTHTTVNGADIEVTASGDDVMVNDARVLCGGVVTDNATVYLVDSVILPPAAK